MKLSISLPDPIAKEISGLAKETERSVSWWIQRAWLTSRDQLRNPVHNDSAKAAALKKLFGLEGVLKGDFPGVSSVELAHRAFKFKKG